MATGRRAKFSVIVARFGATWLAAAVLAGCSPGGDAPATAPEVAAGVAGGPSASGDREAAVARPVIVMLGDSLTAGYGLAQEQALPEQIGVILGERGVSATLVNAGVSGDTTRGGLERFDWSVKQSDADILVIALGANDFLSGIEPAQAEANLRMLIEKAKANGMQVALVGVGLRAREADAREVAYRDLYVRLAETHGLALAPDMLAPLKDRPDLLMQDGLHPTAEGVEAMAAALADFFAGAVSDWAISQAQ